MTEKGLHQLRALHGVGTQSANPSHGEVSEKHVDASHISRMLRSFGAGGRKIADITGDAGAERSIPILYDERVTDIRADAIVAMRLLLDDALIQCGHGGLGSDNDDHVRRRNGELQGISFNGTLDPFRDIVDPQWKYFIRRLSRNADINPKVIDGLLDRDHGEEVLRSIEEAPPLKIEDHGATAATTNDVVDRLYECLEAHLFKGHVGRSAVDKMREPFLWDEKIIENVPMSRLDELVAVSDSVVVSDRMLRDLVRSQARSKALQQAVHGLEEFGFFIDPTDRSFLAHAIESPDFSVDAIEHEGRIIAYYIMRTGNAALEYMKEEFGIDPKIDYRADRSSLPVTAGPIIEASAGYPTVGGLQNDALARRAYRLHWTNEAKAVEIFSEPDIYAAGGEIVVARDCQNFHGLGSALKARKYGNLLRMNPPVPYILITYAEITTVDGKTLADPLSNLGSEAMIRKLGGNKLGSVQKTHRRGSMPLEVTWHVFWSDVQRSLDTLHALRQGK